MFGFRNAQGVFLAVAVALLLLLGAGCGQSQKPQVGKAENYPVKPITIIVPYDPGGGSDLVARILDKHFKEEFGNSLTFVYKPGAGGAVGTTEMAKAPKDGYTIGTLNVPQIVLQALTGSGAFSIDSFEYICQTASDPQVFVTPKNSPYTDLEKFIAAAKANPGKLTVGIPGAMGDGQIAAYMLMEKTGIQVTVVPLKGGSDLLASLLGNHVNAGFANIGVIKSEQEKLNLLGVTYKERHKFLPNTPTFKEKGYDIQSFIGRLFVAPKGVSPEQIKRLEKGFKNIFDKPAFQEDMKKANFSTDWISGGDVKAYLQNYNKEAKVLLDKYHKK